MEIARSKLSSPKLEGKLDQVSQDIFGAIRINPKSYTDAYVSNPDGGIDIFIDGLNARSVALEGDIVCVKLNPVSKWKINYNAIANHWHKWSDRLLPIIEEIEIIDRLQSIKGSNHDSIYPASNSSDFSTNQPQDNEINTSESSNSKTQPARKKRSVNGGTSSTDKQTRLAKLEVSKLPTNLPPGLAKLTIEHILPLPFGDQCIQKTGYVERVIKKRHPGITGGTLRHYSDEFALFSPVDSRIPRILIDIRECPLDFCTQSDRYKNILFIAQLTGWEGKKSLATGNLVRIVGDSNAIESRIETVLMENQIYDVDFPPEVYEELKYLKNLPSDWFAENSKGRRDLTKECIFTIDPKTARDLDDALSVRKISEEIYEIGVHIADVSHFVKELSAVDYHARMRTTSVYLVDRVIPMLPRILCEQMCSLNPNEPKLTYSVIWKMDKYGHVIDEWFGRTIIKSCVKLSYEQAQDMIDNPKDISWIKEDENMPKLTSFSWNHISKSVNILNTVAKNIRMKRFDGGALKIEQVKLKFELDQETGVPNGFSFEQRSDANYLIEEFMLLANMAVAKKIYRYSSEHAFLRRHPASQANLLKEVKEFCDAKGCFLDISNAGSIQRSLNAITDPTMAKVVSFLLLRAMKNAEYICVGSLTQDDSGFSHFALNVPFYTHFTSPIRRYADVIVHRQLSLALGYSEVTNEDVDSLSQMADECTKRKLSSKLISETSQKLFFNLFVQKAGFCELLACVTRIYDRSFDVILVDYNMSGRVYLDRLIGDLRSFKFESSSGVKRLVFNWKQKLSKASNKRSKRRKDLTSQDQEDARTFLQTSKTSALIGEELVTNNVIENETKVEVFDVIRVIVTVDEKDIGKLRIDMKNPRE